MTTFPWCILFFCQIGCINVFVCCIYGSMGWSTFGLISASRGSALACPPSTPPKHFFPGVFSGMSTYKPKLSAWFLLPGGLLWHVHLQTPPKHFQPDFFFPGVWICCAREVNAVWKKEDPKAFNLKYLMWNLCPVRGLIRKALIRKPGNH